MSDIKSLMKEKIEILDRAAKAYYVDGLEIMSNLEYDAIYDELLKLEEESGIVLAGSPTQKVGYEVMSELPKERHPSRMLSLDKTKDREALADWLGNQKGILSWKLDGLTVVLTYRGGELVKAVTRGNGEVGEVITPNARTFTNLPLKIGFTGDLVLRGEAVISYEDFKYINEMIPAADAKYKNPRNLCSGSVRQLDSRVTAERRVKLYAFTLVSAEDEETAPDFKNSRMEQMKWLKSQGFDVVEHALVDAANVVETVGEFEKKVESSPLPSDGLVLTLDDIAYSLSLGTTAKFPRDAIAFKWRDQLAETVLREVEWSASRTGLINPVAIFDPVDLEGTTVSRASLHNVSIARELKLGRGDTIEVYKANMIIPQVARNLTESDSLEVPAFCPVCGKETQLKDEGGIQTLYCVNEECPAKQIKSFTHFVSRDAMDIEGLSEMTIEKLASKGFIKEPADLFNLERYKEEIVNMEGFGEKSFNNLQTSLERAKHTTPAKLLYALGITGIGSANAKVIAKACKNDWNKMMNLSMEELTSIEGIGDIMAKAYRDYFDDPEKMRLLLDLLEKLELDESFEAGDTFMDGLTFVITGSLNRFANRDELKALLEGAGAKVAGSVSAKTSYLINNDLQSGSGKNKKAKGLGIPIVDEEQVVKWLESKEVD